MWLSTRVALVATAASMLLSMTGCTVGPSPTPTIVTSLQATDSSAAATPTTAATSTPIGPGGPGQSAAPVQWEACPAIVSPMASDGSTVTVRCARIPVPLAYDQPRGEWVGLQIAEARAESTPADAPPLIVLRGDPGMTSFSDIASVAASLPEPVREQFAVVTVDLRGTGISALIDCVEPSTASAMLGMGVDPTSPDGATQLAAIGRQLTFDCGDTVGPALTRINSTAAADDLDRVRAALGSPEIAIMGSGGSATVGMTYVDRYPGRVRAAVLDSPSDPLATPEQRAEHTAIAGEQLFDDFAAACMDFDGGCPLGDDPRAAVTALTDRYAVSGIPAGDSVITGGSVLLALLEVLPDRHAWSSLATALAAMDSGDAEPLARLLIDALGGENLTARLSGRVLFTCNDSAERLDADRIERAVNDIAPSAPLFGAYSVALQAWCSSWPTPDDVLASPSGTGAPPILVIGSVLNPRHPFVEAQSVARQLSSAVLLSWQAGVDGAYPTSACIATAVDAYLTSGVVPERGLLCPP